MLSDGIGATKAYKAKSIPIPTSTIDTDTSGSEAIHHDVTYLQPLEGDRVVDGGQLGQETKHHDALQGRHIAGNERVMR